MTVQNDIHRPHVLPLQIEAGKSKDSSRLPHHGFPLVLVQGCGRELFFSCSGNGNGRSWNNRGSNGNYWSSTWNSARNARNLNFNSGGVNPQNNNNRYNGFAVSTNKQWLISLIPAVRQFLQDRLCLELHQGKLELSEVHRGVEFLGAYIKPYRIYVARHAVKRMQKKIAEFDYTKPWVVVRSVNSYLGIFRHTATYNLRSQLLMNERIMRIGRFDELRRKLRDRKILDKHLKTKQL